MNDTITLLASTVVFLDTLGLGDFSKVETPERMAWVVLVLRALPDAPGRFPHGKWGTIQAIETQLIECAATEAERLASVEASP